MIYQAHEKGVENNNFPSARANLKIEMTRAHLILSVAEMKRNWYVYELLLSCCK